MSFTLPYAPVGTETVGVGTYCYRSNGFRFDDLSVRRFVLPEPVLSIGAEQACP